VPLVFLTLKSDKVEDLARAYARRETHKMKEVEDLLSRGGLTVHDITVEPLMDKLEDLQRLDQLIMSAENRRNTALHELERQWVRLGEQLRRNIQVAEGEFKVIQSEGKTAA
jgi:hypothetical protein